MVLLLLAQFASEKTAEEIIDRHLLNSGGIEKLSSIKNIYFEGVTTMGVGNCSIKITKEQSKFCCTEIISEEENIIWLVTERGYGRFSSKRPNFME